MIMSDADDKTAKGLLTQDKLLCKKRSAFQEGGAVSNRPPSAPTALLQFHKCNLSVAQHQGVCHCFILTDPAPFLQLALGDFFSDFFQISFYKKEIVNS